MCSLVHAAPPVRAAPPAAHGFSSSLGRADAAAPLACASEWRPWPRQAGRGYCVATAVVAVAAATGTASAGARSGGQRRPTTGGGSGKPRKASSNAGGDTGSARQAGAASRGRPSRVLPGRVAPARRNVPGDIARPPYLLPGARFDPNDGGMPIHDFSEKSEVKSPEQIKAMRVACALARETLLEAGRAVAPGVTTDEIDKLVHEFIVSRGAYPSPLGYMGFPRSVCTSVNDVIAHGIPDDRPLRDGDILNIDVTVYIGGVHGDNSCMFIAGVADSAAHGLCDVAHRAMMAGIDVCGPGVDFREIGRRIEGVSKEARCLSSPLFYGHGIGNYFHGMPHVIPCSNDVDQGVMMPGMTFTVEPVLVENNDRTYETWDDRWTVQTLTGAKSAQFEHTILITNEGHEILTGPSIDYQALAAKQPARRLAKP